jgi:NAD-dependent DNA ligase
MKLSHKEQQYLRESYIYYIEYGDNNISDHEFDQLCRQLVAEYDTLAPEFTARVSIDSLRAGTGFDISMETYKYFGIT